MPTIDNFMYAEQVVDEETLEVVDGKKHIAENFVDHSIEYSTDLFPGFHFPVQTGFDKIPGFYNYKVRLMLTRSISSERRTSPLIPYCPLPRSSLRSSSFVLVLAPNGLQLRLHPHV